MPRLINTHEEFVKLLKTNDDKLTVVDFTASWCGPCQMIAPVYEEMSKKYTDVDFVKVDVDENEETTEKCEVEAMPTFIFYVNGKNVKELQGASKDKLVEFVEKYRVSNEEIEIEVDNGTRLS